MEKRCQNSKGCERTLAMNINVQWLLISPFLWDKDSETGLDPKESMGHFVFRVND